MSIERKQFPQFFVTAPAECPYLPERKERKVFTHLIGAEAVRLLDALTRGGFRRSQNIAYRPACDNCNKCISVRVPVASFKWSRSFNRIWKKNRQLTTEIKDPKITREMYSLFVRYIETRHHDGGMADMTVLDFSAMVEETSVNTVIIEYRNLAGDLVAVALSDILEDGLSMIYSFYDPSPVQYSLGSYMILEHIERSRKMGLAYTYLGYWIEGSPKMAYKQRFLPQERLTDEGWRLVQ